MRRDITTKMGYLRRGWLCAGGVGVLLALHAALLVSAAREDCATIDEVGHIAAGVSHWQTSTFSIYRVNPPLARMLAVLPVLAAHPNTEGIRPTEQAGVRTEWATRRFFAATNAEHYPSYGF